MKKFMIPLVISAYMIMISLILAYKTVDVRAVYMFWISSLIMIILSIANGIYAMLSNHDERQIHKETMIFKIILIPFYIFNFIAGLMVALTTIFAVLTIWFIVAAIPLAIVGLLMLVSTYLLMLSTGSYNIVIQIKKLRGIKKDSLIDLIITIMHFIFVADLVGAIIINSYDKEKEINYEKRQD